MTGVVIGVLWCDQLVSFANGILYGLHQEEKATIPAALGVVIGGALGVLLVDVGWGVIGSLLGLLIAGIIVAIVTVRHAIHALGSRVSGRSTASSAARTLSVWNVFDDLRRSGDDIVFHRYGLGPSFCRR